MSKQEIIKIFGDHKIRSVWDDEAETWFFSIVDVVAVLTESTNPATYWKVLKNRLKSILAGYLTKWRMPFLELDWLCLA